MLIFLAAGSAFAASNPAAYLKTEAQKASIATLRDIDGGLLYTMDYSADYMLDDVLKSDVDSTEAMLKYIRDKMLLEGALVGGAADANFHFCIADATGKTVVVEYGPGNGKLHVLEENHVKNFYLTPGYDDQSRGRDRYNIIKETLSFKKGILTDTEAMSLLELVSQPETEEATSMTQWSAVYNLTDLTLQLAMKRDYKKQFSFAMEEERGSHGGGCSAGAAPFALAALAPLALFIRKSKKLKK